MTGASPIGHLHGTFFSISHTRISDGPLLLHRSEVRFFTSGNFTSAKIHAAHVDHKIRYSRNPGREVREVERLSAKAPTEGGRSVEVKIRACRCGYYVRVGARLCIESRGPHPSRFVLGLFFGRVSPNRGRSVVRSLMI